MAAEVLVQDVSLDFRLYHFHTRSIRQTVVRSIAGRLGENENHQVVVQALRDGLRGEMRWPMLRAADRMWVRSALPSSSGGVPTARKMQSA